MYKLLYMYMKSAVAVYLLERLSSTLGGRLARRNRRQCFAGGGEQINVLLALQTALNDRQIAAGLRNTPALSQMRCLELAKSRAGWHAHASHMQCNSIPGLYPATNLHKSFAAVCGG